MDTEDAGGVEACGIIVGDGSLCVSGTEGAGGVTVGGKLWFAGALAMETDEDGFDVPWHG